MNEVETIVKSLYDSNERFIFQGGSIFAKRLADLIDSRNNFKMNMDKIKKALLVAADALDIASEWNVDNVQVDPPSEWNLTANGEDTSDGWCSTQDLASKLREIANDAVEARYQASPPPACSQEDRT